MTRALRSAALGVVTLVIAGCSGGTSDGPALPGTPLVPAVGEYRLDRATFERFVVYETGSKPDEVDARARTRLYEELLAEALLARGAERAGIVPDKERMAKVAARFTDLAGPAARPDDVRRDARRQVLARAFEERVSAAPITIDEAALRRELDQAARVAASSIVFRQIRCETEADAERAVKRLRGGVTFEDVAREMSTSPDRGRPLRRSPEELPEPVAATLRSLRVGGASRPTALDGAYYVFQLDARLTGADGLRPRDREEIETRLARREYERRLAQQCAELARVERVRAPLPPPPAEDLTR